MNNNRFKSQLEKLYSKEDNSRCFDCDKIPAHWSSINNGIYLCLDCSGEHRGYGVQMSYIKSVTLDTWTEAQFNLLKVGGNKRLKEFLNKHEMPDYLDKKEVYQSRIMSYYRKMLRAESQGQLFMEPLPSKSEFWNPATIDDNDTNSNINYSNTLFSNSNTNSYYPPQSEPSNSNNPNLNFGFKDDYGYPKSEIIINEDHYAKARKLSNIQSNFSNSVPTQPKFKSGDQKYKNDPRFASISSDPSSFSTRDNSNGGYLSTVGSILGTMWGAGVSAAGMFKDKLNEYEVGSKLYYAGGMMIQGLAYGGSKIIEKGGEVIHSETVQNIGSKAVEGVSYLKNRIIGGNQNSNSVSSDSYSQSFTSRSSDDNYNRY